MKTNKRFLLMSATVWLLPAFQGAMAAPTTPTPAGILAGDMGQNQNQDQDLVPPHEQSGHNRPD